MRTRRLEGASKHACWPRQFVGCPRNQSRRPRKGFTEAEPLSPEWRSRLPSCMSAPASPDLDAFEHHWQDEADAAYLYRLLANAEPDPKKGDLYRRLAAVEDRHVEIWAG